MRAGVGAGRVVRGSKVRIDSSLARNGSRLASQSQVRPFWREDLLLVGGLPISHGELRQGRAEIESHQSKTSDSQRRRLDQDQLDRGEEFEMLLGWVFLLFLLFLLSINV